MFFLIDLILVMEVPLTTSANIPGSNPGLG